MFPLAQCCFEGNECTHTWGPLTLSPHQQPSPRATHGHQVRPTWQACTAAPHDVQSNSYHEHQYVGDSSKTAETCARSSALWIRKPLIAKVSHHSVKMEKDFSLYIFVLLVYTGIYEKPIFHHYIDYNCIYARLNHFFPAIQQIVNIIQYLGNKNHSIVYNIVTMSL